VGHLKSQCGRRQLDLYSSVAVLEKIAPDQSSLSGSVSKLGGNHFDMSDSTILGP